MKLLNDQPIAVMQREKIPSDVIAALSISDESEQRSFDESYLRFLDEHVAAKARGPDWDGLYVARRRNLAEYADVLLTIISAADEMGSYVVKIESESGTVVHWERIAQDSFDYLGK